MDLYDLSMTHDLFGFLSFIPFLLSLLLRALWIFPCSIYRFSFVEETPQSHEHLIRSLHSWKRISAAVSTFL